MTREVNIHKYPYMHKHHWTFLPFYRCISSPWEPSFSILFSPQESVQVDLWSLCDLWSTVRRKKRHAAALLGPGSICFPVVAGTEQTISGLQKLATSWYIHWVYVTPPRGGNWFGFISATVSGCRFNLISSGLYTTRVFVSTVPPVLKPTEWDEEV